MEHYAQFVKRRFRPYLVHVFSDFSVRSNQLHNCDYQVIDRNVFVEFSNMPGIVADRLFAVACNSRLNSSVIMPDFIQLMVDIFSPNLEQKLRVIFKLFDFN